MFKDNPLLAQLKQQIRETIPTVEGVVKATEKNYGFLQTDNKKSYFIAPPQMRRVIHGDRISAVVRDNGDKQSAEPEALIEGALDRFIATVQFKDGKTKLKVDHPLINGYLNAKVTKNAEFKIKQGDWVVAKLVKHALADEQFSAEIESHIADNDDAFARWKATTATHQLAWDEPENIYQYSDLEQLPREDLTQQLFFTIDGENTKDMDDALSIEKTAQGWKLSVAIADPSAYIDPQHPLEAEAQQRGFTLYLPARTVPMMPSELANQHCSLLPNESRKALVCEMHLNQDGSLIDRAKFILANIESKFRLSYQQVSDYLENQHGELDEALSQQLHTLSGMAKARYAWREQNTNVFGDQSDYEFELDNAGKVIEICCKPRRIANAIVEEAMVAANTCAGQFLHQELGFGLFSIHSGFKAEKEKQLQTLLDHFGYDYQAAQLSQLEHFCSLRREISNKQDMLCDGLLKKFYNYSEYSAQAAPHFGLGEQYYATWTSPIRKYCDLVNHRLIKAVINKKVVENPFTDELSAHLSDCRRKHKMAERGMYNYLYTQYFAESDNQPVLEAVIRNVTRGGLQVRLCASGASGFIAKQQFGVKADELEINAELGHLKAADKLYSLGDTIQVTVNQVKLEQQSIQLSLA